MIVEDLMRAGLSVRTISIGTGIPVGSVHRAMRAVVRAEAKREIAVAEIAEKLGTKLPQGPRISELLPARRDHRKHRPHAAISVVAHQAIQCRRFFSTSPRG
jgi:hypothetical protein